MYRDENRLAYAEHLAEVFELIGDDAYRNLGFILKQFVYYVIDLFTRLRIPILSNYLLFANCLF